MHTVHTTLTLEAHRQTAIIGEAEWQRRFAGRTASSPAAAGPRLLSRARRLWAHRPARLLVPGQLVH